MSQQPRKQRKGRENQRWRTRNALLDATRELLTEGIEPTVAEAADAARVSRTTAYRYFRSQEQLLLEASLEGKIIPELDNVSEEIGESTDPYERLDRLIERFEQIVAKHDGEVRTLLRLTLEEPGGRWARRENGPYRPAWLEQVLEVLPEDVDPALRSRLLHGLSICMGPEAHIMLHDIYGLDPSESARACRWAAAAILGAALREAGVESEPEDEKVAP